MRVMGVDPARITMITVQVRYFAGVREAAGAQGEAVELPQGATLADLAARISSANPTLAARIRACRAAVNEEFAAAERVLAHGDEVAFIPPVAGGAPRFSVTSEPVDPASVCAGLADTATGAVVTFTGVVRDNSDGRRVTALEYECYEPMAVREMEKIGDEAEALWPGVRVHGAHRVGLLRPGEVAVVLCAASAHREDAFAACRHLIERIKEDVPIWKKERFEDGVAWVGEG
jgi:molybdopterin synthase catalytic subunit